MTAARSSTTAAPAAPTVTRGAASAARTPAATSAGLLLLRLVTGALLLVHGVPKLSDPAGATGTAASVGVPAPDLAGWLVILGEVGLGALLLVGLLTRVAGGLLVLQMAGVWLLVHAPQGFLVQGQVNGENALLLGAAGLALLFTGAGRFSLDAAAQRVLPRSRG
ncbi:DoxX family protein [Paenibacillus sp. TRM 82003]|uniref:DoxX family protein n=1 Tax=Kineococcus sp. TRM81007 TaxID=2925831 RepID=UPI001F59E5FA|nr:DoxX family protein [Kineococcus sp. TRM81007]MCI2239322.1 DoxX family protein [Kineococcus sp. TRM81007]MCI3925006.1 DoxX family protein [Paenibacillus sp. TRM 82003]